MHDPTTLEGVLAESFRGNPVALDAYRQAQAFAGVLRHPGVAVSDVIALHFRSRVMSGFGAWNAWRCEKCKATAALFAARSESWRCRNGHVVGNAADVAPVPRPTPQAKPPRVVAPPVPSHNGVGSLSVRGYITADSLERLEQQLRSIEARPAAAVRALVVSLDSEGGSVYPALAMRAALRRLAATGRTVVVHVDGLCSSAATLVALGGDFLVASHSSRLMVHKISGGTPQERRDLDAELAVSYLESNPTLDAETIVGYLRDNGDTWFDASAAFKGGWLDCIGTALEARAAAESFARGEDVFSSRLAALAAREETP